MSLGAEGLGVPGATTSKRGDIREKGAGMRIRV